MKNKKTFYITTPLYYPSDNLHIGHAYTTILADIFARYKKENNYDVFFLVGSDEHGQKIQEIANNKNIKPIEFVNGIVNSFKKLWEILDINYNVFERTTDKNHKELSQKVFSELYKKKLVYKSNYKGKYCKSCEEFLTPSQIENNKCKVSKNSLEDFSEDTYFLKISKFSNFLENLLNTEFLFPITRRKEMLNNFIKPGLNDLSITRVSFDWGIKINEDKDHILYVWLDALLGYLSGIKFQNDNKFFNKYWGKDTEIVQLIGKEITRFHSIYWPAILKSLNLRMPNKLISHGWIIMDNNKMSKSIGNVIDPFKIIKEYGLDAVRYYLSTALKLDSDNNYSPELFKNYYNNNLVNNYGNLVSRVSNMILKYFNGKIIETKLDDEIVKFINKIVNDTKKEFDNFNLFEANKHIMKLCDYANKYIEKEKPWTFFNKDDEKLKCILSSLSLIVVISTYLLKPIITKKYQEVFKQFNINDSNINYENILKFEYIKNINVVKSDILFKRKI